MSYQILTLELAPTAEHMGAVEMGWEVVDAEKAETLDAAKEAAMRLWKPFDHPDGRNTNSLCLFLDGTPHHIERYRTTGWRKINEAGGSMMLPDDTLVLVQPSPASRETQETPEEGR